MFGHHKRIQHNNSSVNLYFFSLTTGFLLYIHRLSTLIDQNMIRFIFIAVDGHLILIQMLLQSFETIAVNETFSLELIFRVFLEWSPLLFMGGLVLALPIMISVLLINAGLGMITRSAPSLNIISVGFPAILVAGTILLMLAIPGIIQRIGRFWQEGFSLIGTLWGF